MERIKVRITAGDGRDERTAVMALVERVLSNEGHRLTVVTERSDSHAQTRREMTDEELSEQINVFGVDVVDAG